MIEIKHKTGVKNVKLYKWVCTICKAKGKWIPSVQEALDGGSEHAKAKHP